MSYGDLQSLAKVPLCRENRRFADDNVVLAHGIRANLKTALLRSNLKAKFATISKGKKVLKNLNVNIENENENVCPEKSSKKDTTHTSPEKKVRTRAQRIHLQRKRSMWLRNQKMQPIRRRRRGSNRELSGLTKYKSYAGVYRDPSCNCGMFSNRPISVFLARGRENRRLLEEISQLRVMVYSKKKREKTRKNSARGRTSSGPRLQRPGASPFESSGSRRRSSSATWF